MYILMHVSISVFDATMLLYNFPGDFAAVTNTRALSAMQHDIRHTNCTAYETEYILGNMSIDRKLNCSIDRKNSVVYFLSCALHCFALFCFLFHPTTTEKKRKLILKWDRIQCSEV